MPGTFIFAIILAVFTVAAGIFWRIGARAATEGDARREAASQQPRSRYDMGSGDEASVTELARPWAKGVTFTFLGLTALMVLLSSFNTVSTQNIGIVTSFGKPVGHVGNGAQWVAPWDQVTDMDEAIQVSDYEGNACLTVRIADQQTACVNAKVRWRIQPSDADALFRNYKNSTAGVENGLLTPELQNVANTVFDGYDPVGLLNSKIQQGQPGNPTVPQLGQQVAAQLAAKIGSQVQIVSLFMPNITYDQTVQARLNAVLTQKAQTLVAQQSEQTAAAQAAANRAIAASVSHDPAVLTSRCEDLMEQMIKAGQSPTIGMCNFGGSGTPVIANVSK